MCVLSHQEDPVSTYKNGSIGLGPLDSYSDILGNACSRTVSSIMSWYGYNTFSLSFQVELLSFFLRLCLCRSGILLMNDTYSKSASTII